MSLNQILRGTGNRRATDKIAELRAENQALLRQKAAADDAFTLLHQERREALDSADALRVRLAETELVAGRLARTVDDLTAERDGLYEEAAALRIRLAPYDAAEANQQAVTVPPMIRDTSATEDQATAPIDVRPVWDALGIEPVIDPGQTTWGARNQQQERA
ncbi:hypothetical protein [Streptomyces enissocaesilis]|uniref:Uncharacterized protein n=1 Tax=Streptomyces enissocaesilis TaxID=332589 RepID=A0ABN3WVT5_9ACTN